VKARLVFLIIRGRNHSSSFVNLRPRVLIRRTLGRRFTNDEEWVAMGMSSLSPLGHRGGEDVCA